MSQDRTEPVMLSEVLMPERRLGWLIVSNAVWSRRVRILRWPELEEIIGYFEESCLCAVLLTEHTLEGLKKKTVGI